MEKIKIITILLICSGVLNVFQAVLSIPQAVPEISERTAIELELRDHLVSNHNDIIIRDVIVIQKDLRGLWIFEVCCTNIGMGVDFKEYAKFNSTSKKITDYQVLEYKN